MLIKCDDVVKNEPFVLIKIAKKEYIEKTIKKGHLYMNLASYYRNLENTMKNSFIGDIDEASRSRQIRAHLKIKDDWVEIFGNNPNTHMAINRNQCLYCLYGVRNHNADRIDDETYRHVITKKLINSFPSEDECIEDYAILLFEYPHKTILKINEEMKKKHLTGGIGYVCYDDHYYNEDMEASAISKAIEACFHKKKIYEGQNEYRVVVINNENKKLDNFYIGELENDEYKMINIEKDKDFEIVVKVNYHEKTNEHEEFVTIQKINTYFI